MQPVIKIDRLVKQYRDCKALNEVSFEVPPGVVFALLGENGAGKTTMIRCLTGFEKPTSGRAHVLGLDSVKQSSEVRQRIGYVSDQPALYDWMRADEIGWFASAFFPSGFLNRYNDLIREFEVPGGRKIKQMSKGQRAKVALALAVAHDPELLILDEPTSGLDPMVRRQFLESMVERAAVGKSVFLSSHQISEVERVADWVAIVHQGKLQVMQPLSDLKESVSDLRITLNDAMVEVPLPEGTVFTQERQGRQMRMIAMHITDADLEAMRGASGIVRVDVTQPTLEEIFVACTHGTSPVAVDAAQQAFSIT